MYSSLEPAGATAAVAGRLSSLEPAGATAAVAGRRRTASGDDVGQQATVTFLLLTKIWRDEMNQPALNLCQICLTTVD